MPLRGESIGVAYVKILADGTGFGEDARKKLRDSDSDFRSIGEDHSRAYEEGFTDQEDRIGADFVDGLVAGIRRNSGRFDSIADQLNSDLLDPIEREFKEKFGDIGDEMFQELREGFRRSGGDTDFLDDFIENLERNVESATRRIEKVQIDSAERTALAIRQAEADKQKSIRGTTAEFRALVRQINAYHRSVDSTHADRAALRDDLERIGNKMRELGANTRTFDRDFRDVSSRLRTTHPLLQRLTNSFDGFGDSVARAFGKGARNDFFNLFGRITGFFVSLPGLVTRGIQSFINLGSNIKDTFGEGPLSVIKKFGAGVAGIAIGLGGLAVVMGGVVLVAGVLSSALLSLVGAAVALSSALAFTLGGAIAVVAGALVPLAAGIGVAILAVQNMDKKTKKAFSGIKDSFKDLGKDAAANIFDTPLKDVEAIKNAIEGLKVITGPVSEALGGLLDEFIGSLNDPALKNFQVFLGKTLPDMVTSLGHIFGNLGTAFQGIFIAIAPFVQDFLDNIEQLTQDFSDWTNSVEGQNAIADFMDKAKESADAVGDAIEQITLLIADLFDVSKDTGDNLFSDLANTIKGWREELDKARENGTLQKWFEDAGKTAEAIGSMITELGKFIEKLDTPENRKAVRDLADLFDDLLAAIELIAPPLEVLFTSLFGWVDDSEEAIGSLKKAFRAMGEAFASIYNLLIGPALSAMVEGFADSLDLLADLFRTLGSVPKFGWAKELGDQLQTAADKAHAAAVNVKEIDTDVTVTVTVLAPSQATIDKINAQLGGIHVRAVPVNVTTPRGSNVDTNASQSRITLPSSGNGRIVNVGGVTVVTPTEDPVAVAQELLNRLAAAAYV